MEAPSFPSVAGLEKSEDGSEYIYGGSVGINRILGYLHGTAGQLHAMPWRLYLINVFTLLDNIYDIKLTPKQIDEAFHGEVRILCQYIEAYTSSLPGPYKPPTIVFYIPDYGVIPPKLRRTFKEGGRDDLMGKFYQRFKSSSFSSVPDHIADTPYSQIWAVPVGKGLYPHRDLVSWLRGISSKTPYIFDRDAVGIITHCPIDLHIHRILAQVSLIERYTGAIVSPRFFGKKLSSDGLVPFNMYTHRVFGDKVHLAPLIRGKTKVTLLERAKKKNWLQRPPQDILQDIREITGLTTEELNSLRL